MEDLLKQVAQYLLDSPPAIVGLLVVWGAYRLLVHKRLEAVLHERHTLTEGAIRTAQAEIATAEARTAEYERKLSEARAQVYKHQESFRQRIMDQRAAMLAEARNSAEQRVTLARTDLAKDVAAAQATLEQQAGALADEIVNTVLKPVALVGGR